MGTATNLLKNVHANVESVYLISNFLGFEIEKVESIWDLFESNTIFALLRPKGVDGLFAYISLEPKLGINTRASQYRTFYQAAYLAMEERGQTSTEVDFIIVVGENVLIFFDSADYRRRLIVTPDKLSKNNSKYLTKFNSLRVESIAEKYIKDDWLGDFELDGNFKTELFRFAIADDEQFLRKTRVIRLALWQKIQESEECRKILKNIFFKNATVIDSESNYYGEIISAVLDTLVLRYILVRILEGRFGYENDVAKKSVAKIGLGTTMSIDKLLESKVRFDFEQKNAVLASKKKELTLFDVTPYEINTQEIAEIQKVQTDYMESAYGGDLYVSDIARAATKIESVLSESEYAVTWNMTSSTDLDFDLEDVTPGTIGEQYEQTLQMKLEKNEKGKWEYSKDNSQQRSQGSFYTNATITDYIIEQTLGKRLSEIKEALIDDAKTETRKIAILKDVLKLKIADISSGGGTFLAGIVRKLGNWYSELERISETNKLLPKIKEFRTAIHFQRYAVNHMIYGVDLDLKALIVSSFALTLESLGDSSNKLPELIGRTLVHQNSLISLVPESLKNDWFKTYQAHIKELYEEKKKWRNRKGNKFLDVKTELQQIFASLAIEYLQTRKYDKEILEKTIIDKHMEVLEFNLPEVFFDKEGQPSGGFDIIVGNPPYIQLQKKQIFSDAEKYIYQKLGEFESYEATGDIYALFFERAATLLKEDGLLGFITSNKFLRSGYGQSLRNYLLENTNPYLLVNLGSGMFGATVDTSILALEKATNNNILYAIDLMQRSNDPKGRLENMSDYIEQNKISISYTKDESWIILSPIEQSIKQKIESAGTPLKDWDISINYGIKTGFNEAFIINSEKRDEILNNCQIEDEKLRTAELIRPILRGRDIKRFSYEFADLYLIYIPWHFPLQDDVNIKGASLEAEKLFQKNYPAVYDHLFKYKEKLSSRNKAETGIRYEWYALQRWGANYWDDFNKPKIIYPNMTKYLPFHLDTESFIVNQKCFILTGEKLQYLVSFLNSNVFKICFKDYFPDLQGGTRELSKIFFENIPIPQTMHDYSVTEEDIYKIYNFNEDEINWIRTFECSSEYKC